MRRSQSTTWLLTILTSFYSQIHHSTASPISDLWSVLADGTHILQARCENSCGYYGQVCCASDETCYTDPSNQQASCSAAAPQVTAAPTYGGSSGGCDTCSSSYVYWTSTFTGSDLVTYCSTYSSMWYPTSTYTPPQTTAAPVNCDTSGGGCACGPICCDGSQYCQYEGQCAPKAMSSYIQTQTYVPTSSYASYTAPLRPTTVATTIPTVTTTLGFQPAVTQGSNVTIAADMGGGGLSGGAIAGIVIGVILGIIFLILLCICLCFGAAASSILAFFGLGGKKKESRRVTEERYHHSGSRADGRTWYGAGKPPPKKKKSGIGAGAGLLAALAGFGAAVGFGKAKRRRDEKSESSSGYGYGSYTSYCE